MNMPAATWRCDRCGAMSDAFAKDALETASMPDGWRQGEWLRPGTRVTFDLCRVCSHSFTTWWHKP